MNSIILDGSIIEVTPCCPFCNGPVKRAELRVEDFGPDGSPCYKPVACCSWDDDGDDDAAHFNEERMAKYWRSYIKTGERVATEAIQQRIEFIRECLSHAIEEMRAEQQTD
jgi:hypothetical protein